MEMESEVDPPDLLDLVELERCQGPIRGREGHALALPDIPSVPHAPHPVTQRSGI